MFYKGFSRQPFRDTSTRAVRKPFNSTLPKMRAYTDTGHKKMRAYHTHTDHKKMRAYHTHRPQKNARVSYTHTHHEKNAVIR